MLSGPDTFRLITMWEQYALSILASNPTWVGVKKPGNTIENYYIYRKEYNDNKKLKVIETFSYSTFKTVVEKFFQKAKSAIINGECVSLTNNLGKIAARRVERNHKKKIINYGKTNKQPKIWCEARGRFVREKIIYFTEDDYCRIGWHKYGRIKNESTYEFRPSEMAKSGVGFKQQLSKALNSDPLLKYRYIYYPIS